MWTATLPSDAASSHRQRQGPRRILQGEVERDVATVGQTDDMGRHLADLVEHRRSVGAVGELDILGLGSA